MIIYSVYILNKAGGLIYQNDINPGLNKLSSNDYLVLAGTFHGVHAISTKISPLLKSTGIQQVHMTFFSMYSFQTVTGLKILIITSPVTSLDDEFSNTPLSFNGTNGRNMNNDSITTTSNLSFSPTQRNSLPSLRQQQQQKTTSIGSANLDVNSISADLILKEIYMAYSDYVMKNPFYQLEMPIRCELFDRKLDELLKQ